MHPPRSTGSTHTHLVRGSSWDAMRDAAMLAQMITASGPLTVTTTGSGVRITFDGYIPQFVVAKAVEPVSGQAGRWLGRGIRPALNCNAVGELVLEDLGIVEETHVVELWNCSGGDLVADSPVYGLLLGHRGTADNGRPIVLVLSGGSLPKGEFQHQVFQMVSQNQVGADFVMAHAYPGADEF